MKYLKLVALAIAVVCTLAVLNASSLTSYLARGFLNNAGYQLELMEIGTRATNVRVKSEDLDIEIKALILALPSMLILDELTLQLSESSDDAPVATINELWQQVFEYLPMLPLSGQIRTLRICQENQCERIALDWVTQNEVVLGNAELPEHGARFSFEISDKIDLRFTQRHELLVAVGDAQLWREKGVINLDLNLIGQPQLTKFELPVDVTVKSMVGQFELRVEADTLVDQVMDQVILSGKLGSEAEWQYQFDDMVASAKGLYQFNMGYGEGQIRIGLLEQPAFALFKGDSVSATAMLTGNTNCLMPIVMDNIDCNVDGIETSINLEGFAADLSVQGLSFGQHQASQWADANLSFSLFDLTSGKEVLVGQSGIKLFDNQLSVQLKDTIAAGNPLELSAGYGIETNNLDFELGFTGRLENSTAYLVEFDQNGMLEQVVGDIRIQSAGSARVGAGVGVGINHKTNISLANVAFDYDGFELEQAEFSASFSGWPTIDGDVTVDAGRFNTGIPLENIHAELGMRADVDANVLGLVGRSLRLDVLGGIVRSDAFKYDSASQKGSADIHLQGVQLPQLLALQRQDFQCSGTLDGSVPVHIEGDSMTISGALVAATAEGGFIRYTPDESVASMGAQNQGLSVVLAAMSDFQYHRLAAQIDYSADGLMIAQTELKGANPGYQDGREVHLNLTLEENIKTLLQSLRLGGEVAERIGNKQI